MVRKKLVVIIIAFCSFSVFGHISIVPVRAMVENITPEVAYEMITNSTLYPDLIILDVRTQGEYDAEHICNATLIPLNDLESRLNELYPYNNTEIIVYCQSGSRSLDASQILNTNGFTEVNNMLGGITAWKNAGYDVCTDDNGTDTNGQGQLTISFSFASFIIVLSVAIAIILIYHKNRKLKL